jgi:hypothetical protein
MQKSGIEYSDFYKLIGRLTTSNNKDAMNEIIYNLPLTNDAQSYFLQLSDECVKNAYGNTVEQKIQFDQRYFNELKKIIKNGNC